MGSAWVARRALASAVRAVSQVPQTLASAWMAVRADPVRTALGAYPAQAAVAVAVRVAVQSLAEAGVVVASEEEVEVVDAVVPVEDAVLRQLTAEASLATVSIVDAASNGG
jgi:hypothetical protein